MKEINRIIAQMNIAPTQYLTVGAIFYGGYIDAFSSDQPNPYVLDSFFQEPIGKTARKFVIYNPGERDFYYKNIKEKIEQESLCFVTNPHPSFLVSAMRQLHNFLPTNKEIVLCGDRTYKIDGKEYFLSVKEGMGIKRLSFNDCHKKQPGVKTFLLLEVIQ